MFTKVVYKVVAVGKRGRPRNRDDRRSYLLTNTPPGRRTLRRATTDFEGLNARWTAALGVDGDRELQGLLRKLIGA
jgi:DNA-binding MarR family transcriptional regulator